MATEPAADAALPGMFNRRGLPAMLLGLAVLLVLASFAVGWFSIEAVLRTYEYDPSAPQNMGNEKITLRLDLEMEMTSISYQATPLEIENQVRERGEPNYDDHAGRIGTVMLGVLMMQFVVLVSLLCFVGFYYLQRRGRHSYAAVAKRLFLVFAVLVVLMMLYFAVRIGPAAEDDEEYMLNAYRFQRDAAVQPFKPQVGFWKTWESLPERIDNPATQEPEMWVLIVHSRPSAGFWLTLAALGCVTGARVVAARNGDFSDAEAQEPLPNLPKIASG